MDDKGLKMAEMNGAEKHLNNLIKRELVTSDGQLKTELQIVFDNVCGNHGLEEFRRYVFPRLIRGYRTNHNEAAREGLRIIQEGAALPASEIGAYFKSKGWGE